MLPEEWTKWIQSNLQRGCNPDEMIRKMYMAGLPKDKATYFVDTNIQQLYKHRQLSLEKCVSVPSPLTRKNVICLGNNQTNLYIVDNFLTPLECSQIIKKSQGRFHPSELTDTGEVNFRTSQTHDFTRSDHFYQYIDSKIAILMDIPNTYAEDTQVQYYQINNQFKPHTDYFDPSLKEWTVYGAHRGQRTWTVTIYLNEVQEGGETYFPHLDISIKPKTGKALVWNNLSGDGQVNPETLHQGLPVIRGEKYIITKWFRTRPQT